MNNFRLAFISELPKEHFPFWQDGLWAALNYLVNGHGWGVDVFNIPSMKRANVPEGYDFYLFWGALDRPQHTRRLFARQGLCFGGGSTYHPNMKNFDVIFVENKIDIAPFEGYGIKTFQAFGTNTQLFKPMKLLKPFEYIYPAAFAKWKRHDRFVEYVKKHHSSPQAGSLAVGYMQPGGWEKECYEICEQNGIAVLPWVPSDVLARLYNMSHNTIVTADPMGGCQRTVLEAKACNIPIIIDSESEKLKEFEKFTHEDVVEKWNEKMYGEKLKQGIEEVLNG